jgi:uncharacterized membrane protein YtjA (UPF0391 family)
MGLLGWAFVFLIVALVAALLGFTDVAKGAAAISRVLFGLFLLIFVVLLLMALIGTCTVAAV